MLVRCSRTRRSITSIAYISFKRFRPFLCQAIRWSVCLWVLSGQIWYYPRVLLQLAYFYTQYYKTLPITKLHRIIAQEIKFWSKYPSLCYITEEELGEEISNLDTCIPRGGIVFKRALVCNSNSEWQWTVSIFQYLKSWYPMFPMFPNSIMERRK